jgi:hypothetical protein
MNSTARYFVTPLFSFAAVFGVFCSSARATYIATFNEIGTDVVATGSGSLDITVFGGLPGNFSGGAVENPSFGLLILGTTSPPGALFDGYSGGISGPTSFGSGGGVNAKLGGGSMVGINGNFGVLFVPKGYVSGASLTSTDTWSNASFASLGMTPGTYTWTWGTGMNADSLILQIGAASATNGVPDSGSTIALMLAAVAPLIAFRSKPLARG